MCKTIKMAAPVMAAAMAGCFGTGGAPTSTGRQAPGGPSGIETTPLGESAIEKAKEWSQKYAMLAGDHMKLQRESQTLTGKNQQLEAQLVKSQTELTQARNELEDANEMLAEMNDELAKWRADVLGFRDEMRQAQRVQLDYMLKIIQLVGGELPEPTTSSAPAKEGAEE